MGILSVEEERIYDKASDTKYFSTWDKNELKPLAEELNKGLNETEKLVIDLSDRLHRELTNGFKEEMTALAHKHGKSLNLP